MKRFLLSSVAASLLASNAMALVSVDDLPEKSMYYTAWGQDGSAADEFVLQANSNSGFKTPGNRINALYLSFLRWDGFGNIKDDNDFIYSADTSWTSSGYKDIRKIYNSVNNGAISGQKTKMIVTFGGASYSGMWDAILEDSYRENLARNLVALMGNKIGRYWNGYRNIEGLSIDGIDFDFERQVRITPELNDAFVKLIQRVREIQHDPHMLEELGVTSEAVKDDILMLTTYHVGADPVECTTNLNMGPDEGCSFVNDGRSLHHGEVLRLLETMKGQDLFDGYNIMLYDAGTLEDFHPDVAVKNYLKYLPANRVNVGFSIKPQWKPADETGSQFVQNEDEAFMMMKLYQKLGIHGYFIWSVGGVDSKADEDIRTHYRYAKAWEGITAVEDEYIPNDFEPKSETTQPATISKLGRDHNIVEKDGKQYVAFANTWYELEPSKPDSEEAGDSVDEDAGSEEVGEVADEAIDTSKNIIENGSFEISALESTDFKVSMQRTMPGWETASTIFEVWSKYGKRATDGHFKLELDTNRAPDELYQMVHGMKDYKYTLSIDAYARRNGTSDLEVLVNDQVVMKIHPSTRYWQRYSVDVIGSVDMKISIREVRGQNNGLGALIDNVQLKNKGIKVLKRSGDVTTMIGGGMPEAETPKLSEMKVERIYL